MKAVLPRAIQLCLHLATRLRPLHHGVIVLLQGTKSKPRLGLFTFQSIKDYFLYAPSTYFP